tara:strand:+ start:12 stop:716 length:705 start_codon:yes stop_codon:yes gene_type:complete
MKIIDKKNEFDHVKIAEKVWENYSIVFVEYFFLKKFKNNGDNVTTKGDHFLKELKNNNEKVIFVSGHFANYEIMSMELVKRGFKLATIYRPLNNFFINPMMEFLRRKYVCKNQIVKGTKGLREILKYLDEDFNIALMIDQRVSEGEKINLFEKPAWTTTLPAQISTRFNLKVVPIDFNRNEQGQYEMRILKPIDFQNNVNEATKIKVSEELNHILENMIIKKPNQWILTHNRWK